MTLQEFIEKAKTDEALRAKVNASIMENVIMPMAKAEGVELTNDELAGVSGGFGFGFGFGFGDSQSSGDLRLR